MVKPATRQKMTNKKSSLNIFGNMTKEINDKSSGRNPMFETICCKSEWDYI